MPGWQCLGAPRLQPEQVPCLVSAQPSGGPLVQLHGANIKVPGRRAHFQLTGKSNVGRELPRLWRLVTA